MKLSLINLINDIMDRYIKIMMMLSMFAASSINAQQYSPKEIRTFSKKLQSNWSGTGKYMNPIFPEG